MEVVVTGERVTGVAVMVMGQRGRTPGAYHLTFVSAIDNMLPKRRIRAFLHVRTSGHQDNISRPASSSYSGHVSIV